MSSITQQQQHQPQFKMQRASTQLSISLHNNQQQQQHLMRGNLNKNFGSSHDLKLPEVKTSKNAEKMKEVKKTRAPPPPTAVNQKSNLNRTKVRTEKFLRFFQLKNEFFFLDVSIDHVISSIIRSGLLKNEREANDNEPETFWRYINEKFHSKSNLSAAAIYTNASNQVKRARCREECRLQNCATPCGYHCC